MGFELDAFFGGSADLRQWPRVLPAAVVCPLGGALALVPVTSALLQALRARAPESIPVGDGAAPAVHAWAVVASRKTILAYLSAGEFGNASLDFHGAYLT